MKITILLPYKNRFICFFSLYRAMAGVSNKRKYRAEDVLDMLFSLPSEDEFDDSLEDSDTDNPVVEDIPHDISHDTSDTSESTDTDDDNILYQLASPNVVMNWSDPEFSDTNSTSSNETASSDDEPEDPLWHKREFVVPDVEFDDVNVLPKQPFLDSDGPAKFFEMFFTAEVIDNLVQQTNLYAEQNGTRHWHETTSSEIKSFLGLLIAMGIHRLPNYRQFWSTDPFFRVQQIADVMSRSRVEKLRSNLHVNDNTKRVPRDHQAYDKLHKIRPILTQMNELYQKQAVSSYSQSVDEAMILFKGRSSFRQYMPMKPIKRGFKVWVRADGKTGYVYQIDIYTGKEESYAFCTRVLKHLTEPLIGTGTHVRFDNFFSTVDLMEELLEKKIYATCTVRPNRRDLPLVAKQ